MALQLLPKIRLLFSEDIWTCSLIPLGLLKWPCNCFLKPFAVFCAGVRKPFGLIQGLFPPRKMELHSKPATWGVEYISRGVQDTKKGWCATLTDKEPFFQLSLYGLYTLSGFSVEGCSSRPYTPLSTKVAHAEDKSAWKFYQDKQGNHKVS